MPRRKVKKPPLPIPIRKDITAATKGKPTHPRIPTQRLISTYHALNKQLAHLVKNGETAKAEEVKKEMEGLGGLHAYQRASLRGGNERKGLGACGTWVLPHLRKEHQAQFDADETRSDLPKKRQKGPSLRLLDVGALSGETYARQKGWLDVTSIDLNPQHLSVMKQDFFERPLPSSDTEKFHVISLSLVVNFVGDPKDRGIMLSRTREFLLPNGLLFLVVPLPCVTNSRYMTHKHLLDIMSSLHFRVQEHRFSPKLAFYLFKLDGHSTTLLPPGTWSKKEIHPGVSRNNFCICI
ncbi:putative methyltransferase-domain-containing protein [Phlyctochytrium arcticum]|nr:putative methyltransferase-domain-containing protein [Phlyctochytrium arcticum]